MMKKIIRWTGALLFCTLLLCGCQTKDIREEAERQEPAQEEKKEVRIISDSEIETEEEEEDNPGEAPAAAEKTVEKKGILIALDPGHQSEAVDMSASEPNAPGSDVMKMKATGGTRGSCTGIPEYQLNLDIALAVRDILAAQGYDVLLTRENNETAISNAERASLANEQGADISVRIHANGSEDPGANGALAMVGSAENPYVGHLYGDSSRLAEAVLNAYCGASGMQNLGIQTTDSMTGINWSTIPVMILEMGFMTNEQDDTNMADPAFRQRMAEGIAAGINAYYGYE